MSELVTYVLETWFGVFLFVLFCDLFRSAVSGD